MWSFITARVLADLTLRSAPSFGKLSFTSICFTINKVLLAKHKKKISSQETNFISIHLTWRGLVNWTNNLLPTLHNCKMLNSFDFMFA